METFFARNRLSAYLDGTLSSAEAAEVAAAIEADPVLKAEYRDMVRAVTLLREEGPVAAPPGFQARALEALRDEPRPGGPLLRARVWFSKVPIEAVALAAAAVVVISVVGVRPSSDNPDPTDTKAVHPAASLDLPSADAPEPSARTATPEPPAPASPPPEATASKPAAPAASQPVVSKSPQKTTKKAAIPTPKEPMQADWERQPQAGEYGSKSPAASSPVSAYRVVVRDSNTLYSLGSLATLHGGSAREASGRLLEPRTLTETNDYAQVLISVPTTRANALHGDLAAMGGERTTPPSTVPSFASEDATIFVVEVRFKP